MPTSFSPALRITPTAMARPNNTSKTAPTFFTNVGACLFYENEIKPAGADRICPLLSPSRCATDRLAQGNDKNVLLLGGHAFGLTPPGIEFYIFAVHLDGFIGAYPHIILLLGGQLAHGLRSGLILADRHRLGLLKLAAGTILHLVACGLSPLLFPGHLKAFLGSGDFRNAGTLGVNVIGHGLTAAVIAL